MSYHNFDSDKEQKSHLLRKSSSSFFFFFFLRFSLKFEIRFN
uniref:Uncharacterized protein n=1 Tax=Rhizophora mucronata TaxID=61149 RepID=A0A2P2ITR9_RHIMU